MSRYTAAATSYAESVTRELLPACNWTRLAAQRQLADLQRKPSPDWPWVFDVDRASRPCEFIELMPHIKGKWARERRLIDLEPWQCFVLTTVFGWVHAETHLRRYREAYVEVPRKNAKSTLSSGLALFMLSADGEHGAEVYSAATTRDQARIVFDDARDMAARTPDLRTELGVAIMQHSITVAHTASKFAPLAAEGSTLDGLNVHFAVIDELHAHKTRAVYDVIDTARGAREQSLLWCITTAGTDTSGICYERRTHVTKVLEGVVDDPAMFGVIYSIDAGDDPLVPASWAKANPNWGKSVLKEDMEASARKAGVMPSALNNFLTKRLNVWVNGASAWMDMVGWNKCLSKLTIDQFFGEPCWIGMDLAEKHDFASICLVFARDDQWHVFPRLYLNESAIEESGNAHLQGWARMGHVITTEGNVTDYDVIADDLRQACRDFDVREIPFDPKQSQYFARKLLDEGLPLVEIKQTPVFYNQPLLMVQNSVLERKIFHSGNPVFTWMMSNVVVKVSQFSKLRQPMKERPENKIDGPVAMLMAMGRAMTTVDDGYADQAFVDLNAIMAAAA